jgi:hypothetical protein
MQYADENDDEILRAYLRRKMSPEYQDVVEDRRARGDELRGQGQLASVLSKTASAFGSVGGQQAKSLYDPSALGAAADRSESRAVRDEADTMQLYSYLDKKAREEKADALANKRLGLEEQRLASQTARDAEKRDSELAWKEREYNQKERLEKNRLMADVGKRAEETRVKQAEKTAEQTKSMLEPRTRAANIERNANELYNLIDKYGTYEMTGPASSMIDSKIYQLAIEYAKLVDPTSVAREGEVATAQKYMLPVKGMFKSNSTAKELINKFKQDAQNALASRESVLRGEKPDVGMAQDTAPGEAIAAPAGGPKVGEAQDGYIFKGGDPGDPNSWSKEAP